MREADERHDRDISRRHRSELFVSGVCEERIADHERCVMPFCECGCHSGETPAIWRGYPRIPEPMVDAGAANIWDHLGAYHGYDAALYNNTASSAILWHDQAHRDGNYGEHDDVHRHATIP
jgi:hypothetical protein